MMNIDLKHLDHSPRLAYLLCLVAGALMTLSFAPYNAWPLAMVALAVLLWQTQHCSAQHAWWRGWWFGVGLFGAGVWWVYIAIRYFGNAAPILAVLTTALLVTYLALFPGLVALLIARYFSQPSPSSACIAFPCAWTLSEFLRGWLMTGFPWLLTGYSQISSPLSSFAPILGVYGLSFLTAFCAGALVWLLHQPPRAYYRQPAAYALLTIWLCSFGLHHHTWTQPNHKALTVSLVQGNITRDMKWNPQSAINNINTYRQLTAPLWDADFIVWPESSFSLNQQYGASLLAAIAAEAKQHNSNLALGLPYLADNGDYYNALMLMGEAQGRYFKRHLVPFGEFTPLSGVLGPLIRWLKIPMSDFQRGDENQGILTVKGIPIAPYICYEIVYPGLVNRDVPQAQMLLTISEDAWYGDSKAVDQHLQMAQMRALESGRYSLFAVNTGISAIIDPQGQVIESLGLHRSGVISAKVPAYIGATPWAIIGDAPGLLMMLISLLVLLRRRIMTMLRASTPLKA